MKSNGPSLDVHFECLISDGVNTKTPEPDQKHYWTTMIKWRPCISRSDIHWQPSSLDSLHGSHVELTSSWHTSKYDIVQQLRYQLMTYDLQVFYKKVSHLSHFYKYHWYFLVLATYQLCDMLSKIAEASELDTPLWI